MKILGIDPGSTNIGWAVLEEVELEEYECPILRDWGFLSAKSSYKRFNSQMTDFHRQVYVYFESKLRERSITHIAVELPTIRRMSQGAKVIGTTTVLKCLAWQFGCQLQFLQPRTVKSTGTGCATATKEDVRQNVYDLYPNMPIVDNLPYDVYDAIMIAHVSLVKGDWWSFV